MGRAPGAMGLRVVVSLVLAGGFAGAGGAEEMLPIPGATFLMGRDDGPADERPAHRVMLSPFALDKVPVTNAAFARFLSAVGVRNSRGERLYDDDDADARIHRRHGAFRSDPGYEDHPVVEATWPGARDFCAWAGKRLPTEAEWEYAARGTGGRAYPWGDAPPDRTRGQFAAPWNATVPVGRFPAGASPFGVLDLAGNVWEWVSSAYRPYPYRADDGRDDLASVEVERGTRGGGHDAPPEDLRATQRGRHVSRRAAAGHHNIGFRCSRSR